jgi:hypothetical protein
METIKKYVPLAIGTHLCLCVLFYGGCYLTVKRGIDVKKVMNFFKITDSKYTSGLGTAGIALGLYKIIMPARLLVTAAFVPVLATWLGKDVDQGVFNEDRDQTLDSNPK